MKLRIDIREVTDAVVARSLASRFAIASGLNPKASAELAIAVSELATNVVKHAQTAGVIHLRRSPRAVHLIVDDFGPGLAFPAKLFEERAASVEPGAWRNGLGCGGGALVRLLDCVRAENRPAGGLRVHGLKRLSTLTHGSAR